MDVHNCVVRFTWLAENSAEYTTLSSECHVDLCGHWPVIGTSDIKGELKLFI